MPLRGPGGKTHFVLDALIGFDDDPDCSLIVLLAANVLPEQKRIGVLAGALVNDRMIVIISS